jgi:hypothetical protein
MNPRTIDERTDIVSAHVRGLGADSVIRQRSTVRLLAKCDLVLTAIWHLVCKFHVAVHGIIDGLDTIGVVHCKLRVVFCLNGLVDDTVNDTEGVKVEVNSFHCTIGDFLILLMEVIEESWAIVASITFSPQAEILRLDSVVQLR